MNGHAEDDGARHDRWPVSVKGVVLRDDNVLLALNDRDEWELPGGRLEPGESLEQCAEREIAEETGLHAIAGPVVHSWVFEAIPGRNVVVIVYGCHIDAATVRPRVSEEHADVRFAHLDSLDQLSLPDGYRVAIRAWRSDGRRASG